MKFKVGDKVLLTGNFLQNLPKLANKLKDGGIITIVYKDEAKINFYNGATYVIWFSSLKLKFPKNTQLVFDFME
jgi:hypothetical protein